MKALDIFFSDLTPEAQQRVLDLYGYKTPADGNLDTDTIPLFSLTYYPSDAYCPFDD